MKGNSEKNHLTVSADVVAEIQIGATAIKNSIYGKLLGPKINNKLNFDAYVKCLCKM